MARAEESALDGAEMRGVWARGWTKALCPLTKTLLMIYRDFRGKDQIIHRTPFLKDLSPAHLMQFYLPGHWIPLFASPASSASGHRVCVKLLVDLPFQLRCPFARESSLHPRHLFFSISCPFILFLWVLTPVGNLLVLIWLMPPENGHWCPAPRRGLRFGQYWAHSKWALRKHLLEAGYWEYGVERVCSFLKEYMMLVVYWNRCHP